MNLTGLAMDVVESLAERHHNPEDRPAGMAEPRFPISDTVSVSKSGGLYVYHLPHGELGLGASFGNSSTWAETKGTGDMLNLFNIELGKRVLGGMSISYLLPFWDLTFAGRPGPEEPDDGPRLQPDRLARVLPSAEGEMHLHPAFQQREFMIGDGLYVLETFSLPKTNAHDPCSACTTVSLTNRTSRPIALSVVASLALRGETERDIVATYREDADCLLAWNESEPDWVRAFGVDGGTRGYLVSTDAERAYYPKSALPKAIEAKGDVIAALQSDVFLLPGASKKLAFISAFSPHGQEETLDAYRRAGNHKGLLKDTIDYYGAKLAHSTIECPDSMIAQGVSWAKACLIRPLANYPIGFGSTNDPGRSSNLVGRDTAWFVFGSDYVDPKASCALLETLVEHQRDDGLLPEYVDGIAGREEFHGFNINDATPLFLMAAGHHVKCAGNACLETLLESMIKAGDLIVSQMDERNLVVCTADGWGAEGICGWRNVLRNEQINGAVTEVNAECYAGLGSLAEVCELAGRNVTAATYRERADAIKDAIAKYLVDPETGLYVRNIDLEGNVFTQSCVDMVFPLICGVAPESTRRIVCERLSEPDFLSPAGIRVLPQDNPCYDPSKESGCLGGVWPGATWWYAMGISETHPDALANALGGSYRHYIEAPRAFDTVPGQFSEWSDGETFVNRGMRLSPWEAPRFLWAALEGLAGVRPGYGSLRIRPMLPNAWKWMHVSNVPVQGRSVSYFLARRGQSLDLVTDTDVEYDGRKTVYETRLEPPETLAAGVATAAFKGHGEVLIALGNSLGDGVSGPFLAHHALNSGMRYRVKSLVSPDSEWKEVGALSGADLQRINVRLEPSGYALFRFVET